MTTPNSPSAQKIAHNWKLVDNPDSDFIDIENDTGYEMCRVTKSGASSALDHGIAKLIVRAVNSHEALLEACKFLIAQVETLAYHSFSDGVQEWLSKNDAVNCGKRAISLAEKP